MDRESSLWRKYLRRDPTPLLLEADANPSVFLWCLIDLAHRPENSAVVTEARDRVLFSPPVQEILTAQHAEGYWATATSLAEPYYHATLWNLALLAELGIPRDSRRARAACEFALENFLDREGRFSGLDLVESSYLIHALSYFRNASEARVARAAGALIALAEEAHSLEELVMPLWAWADSRNDVEISAGAGRARERLLDLLSAIDANRLAPITFPPFNPRDPLFILRVLATLDCANDPRAGRLVDWVLGKQNERGQWPLELSLNGSLTAHTEEATSSSRWATCSALRVIVKLVASDT